MAVDSFLDPRFRWLNEPESWNVDDPTGQQEGSRGSHSLSSDGKELTITPPAYKDFWRRTFYSPTLIKGDASAFLFPTPAEEECTVELDFKLSPKNQFDQAGILIFLDQSHWVKAGIEYCDGAPRMSCVVCNVFSDWSTQPWPSCEARLRLHKVLQGSSLVVEAAEAGASDFQFVRIAHLSARASHGGEGLEVEARDRGEELPWQVGPYAACPMSQKGCVAHFWNIRIGPRLEAVHSSDASAMA